MKHWSGRLLKHVRVPKAHERAAVMVLAGVVVVGAALVYLSEYSRIFAFEYRSEAADAAEHAIAPPVLDRADYDARLLALAHVASTTATTTEAAASSTPRLWPVKAVYPQAGAILPFQRIVAYYGNFYSKQMGVLGEYPAGQMMAMLASTTASWTAADPTTPAVPAIQYIAVVAQGQAGADGTYRARMPDDQIDLALSMANQMHGLLILDVQVGLSTLPKELPLLEKYLKLPNVELAIDPEFSMKHGERPGTVIGTFDAVDVNYAAMYLASLVNTYHLPPKVLIVHRFTQAMVTGYARIKPLPEVQVVIDMDGWGSQAKKRGTYTQVIAPEPVQFTGMKLFYKNDLKPPSTGMLSERDVLSLTPAPIYIQYQ